MLIKKASDAISETGIKAILYGASGTGKTTQIKTLVDAGYKPIVISAESGLLSLQGCSVDVIDISRDDKNNLVSPDKRFERMGDAYTFLLNGKHNYDTIVLDSLTEINSCLMDHLRVKHPDAKDTLKMYGENSQLMQKVIKSFRDLKYNVVLIALESIDKDDLGKRFTNIDLVGKVANNVPPLFDEVLYLFVDDTGKRNILTNKTDRTIAKDRSGRLSLLEEADLGKIFKKIKQTNTENK